MSLVVLGKIPHEIHLVISCELGDGDWKLEDLMKVSLSELQAQQRAAASDTFGKGREKTVKTHSTTAAYLIGGQKVPLYLLLLSAVTFLHACTNVESIDERKRIVQSAGLCFMCLRRGYYTLSVNASQRAGVIVVVDTIMKASAVDRRQHQVTQGPRKFTRLNFPTMTNLSTGMNTAAPILSNHLHLSNHSHPLLSGLVTARPFCCRQPEPMSSIQLLRKGLVRCELFLIQAANTPM